MHMAEPWVPCRYIWGRISIGFIKDARDIINSFQPRLSNIRDGDNIKTIGCKVFASVEAPIVFDFMTNAHADGSKVHKDAARLGRDSRRGGVRGGKGRWRLGWCVRAVLVACRLIAWNRNR